MTVALTAALVLVAMAARWPLSRSTPVNAHAAQAPTTALFMVLLGTGIVMLGMLAVFAWSGRRRKDDPPEREPTKIEMSWISKLIATLLPFALGAAVVTAAVIGTRSVQQPPRLGGQGLRGASPPSARSTSPGSGFVLESWLPWTALGIVLLAVAGGLFVLWRRRERAAAGSAEKNAIRAAVEAAVGTLDAERDPRLAVIAAYTAMQRTLSEHGIPRAPAEAPREYLRRVLLGSQATEHQAITLTGLFEEARYSSHPIPERVREAALSALRSLQARLRAEAER